MLATNTKPQIKRYNDIQGAKTSRNVCRCVVMFVSIAVGVAIVVGSIYLAKYLKRPKLPSESLLDDANFYVYRNAEKFLLAWSHTNKSLIGGQPAYTQLLSDKKHIGILQAFIKKHHFSSVFAFAGSIQYGLSDFRQQQLPYQNLLTNFFEQISATPGLLFYLNDEPQNFTGYDETPVFAQALNSFNERQLASKKVEQIFFQARPEDQGGIMKYLESAHLLNKNVKSCKVFITVTYEQVHQDLSVGKDLYPNLDIVKNCPECENLAQFAQKAGLQAVIFEQGKNEFQRQASQNTLRRNGFQGSIWHVFNTSSVQFESRLQALSYSQELITTLDSDDLKFGFSSYLECFRSFYGMEPFESDEGYLLDLCLM